MEVLEEERSVRAGTLSSIRLLNGRTLRCGVDGAVALIEEKDIGQPGSSSSLYVRTAHLLEDFLRWHYEDLAAGMTAMRRSAVNPRDECSCTEPCCSRIDPSTRYDVHSCAGTRSATEDNLDCRCEVDGGATKAASGCGDSIQRPALARAVDQELTGIVCFEQVRGSERERSTRWRQRWFRSEIRKLQDPTGIADLPPPKPLLAHRAAQRYILWPI